jgi:hypothetical protein
VSSRPLRTALLIACMALGCVRARTRAGDAFDRGDYLTAERLYDEWLRESPGDDYAISMRSRARQRALSSLLAAARAARNKELAIYVRDLGGAVARASLWASDLDDEVKRTLADELRAAEGILRKHIAEPAAAGRALAAEAALWTVMPLLEQQALATLRRELTREVVRSGREACARYTTHARADTPYFTLLVARYCQRVGGRAPATVPLPDLRAAPVFEGSVAGLTPAQLVELQRRVQDFFVLSIWYSPTARVVPRITVGGVADVRFSRRRVALKARWTEQVAYTASESHQVAHQVPYTATETYTESVPTTTYQSYSYSCGTGTCTGSRPTTSYQSQTRSRMVTRYRTEYRTEQRSVTRYRSVPRVFHYEADEHTGSYASDVDLFVDLRVAEPVEFHHDTAVKRRGLEHDVTFAPARVAPSRHGLPLAEEWFEIELTHLGHRLLVDLDKAWVSRFCASQDYTVEEAARCAYAGSAPPPAASAVLNRTLNEPVALLQRALAAKSLETR